MKISRDAIFMYAYDQRVRLNVGHLGLVELDLILTFMEGVFGSGINE